MKEFQADLSSEAIVLHDLVQEVRTLRQAVENLESKLALEDKPTYTANEILKLFGLPVNNSRKRIVTKWFRAGYLNKLHGNQPRLFDGDEVRTLKNAWKCGKIDLPFQ